MTDEVKPCPFCGGEADEHRDPGPTGELYVWVGCNDCDATSACVDERSMQPEESDAVTLWNTRAEPEAAPVEPVAFLYTDEEGGRVACVEQIEPPFEGWTETPLYNHPLAAPTDALVEKAREWAIVVREADKQWSQPLSTLLEQLAAALAAMQEAKP